MRARRTSSALIADRDKDKAIRGYDLLRVRAADATMLHLSAERQIDLPTVLAGSTATACSTPADP
jgi:hypothetical protein